MPNFEGEFKMPQQSEEVKQEQGEFGEIARGFMGNKCVGAFGPQSETEARQTGDYSRLEYVVVGERRSSCMDDRGEGLGVQLPGNRAVSEIASEYTDINSPEERISVKVSKKIRELVAMERQPQFHGDKTHGKKGCAALLFVRESLGYMAENPDAAAQDAYHLLRLVGIDSIGIHDLKMRAMIAGQRADDDTLWDASSEQLIDIALENGADYTEFKGAHHTAGIREDVSPHGFNNRAFRNEHRTDDGYKLGALSLTYGLYIEQLREDGYTEEGIANGAAGVILHSAAMKRLACKPSAVDVIVGYGHMLD